MMGGMNETSVPAPPVWQADVFTALKKHGIRQIAYVPDSGHSHVIREASGTPPSTTWC